MNNDREISYQCSLKTCPNCETVTEDTTSICPDCGLIYSRDLRPEDYELLEKADSIHIKSNEDKTELKMFFWQKDKGFVVAGQKALEKINEMTMSFDGHIERIKNPKFIALIRAKGKWL